MRVAIIDYGSGNLRSAEKAFERMAAERNIAAEILVTGDPEMVQSSDRVVLPGVGAFGDCRAGLADIPGMMTVLEEAVIQKAKPFFGICVGMQLMATWGHENGEHQGFGWIPGTVEKIKPSDPALKIPHMGWNELITGHNSHAVLKDLPTSDANVYFVHSYSMRPNNKGHILSEVDYGGSIVAMVGRDNMIGTQFHPEKSQAFGLALIGNFLEWRP